MLLKHYKKIKCWIMNERTSFIPITLRSSWLLWRRLPISQCDMKSDSNEIVLNLSELVYNLHFIICTDEPTYRWWKGNTKNLRWKHLNHFSFGVIEFIVNHLLTFNCPSQKKRDQCHTLCVNTSRVSRLNSPINYFKHLFPKNSVSCCFFFFTGLFTFLS